VKLFEALFIVFIGFFAFAPSTSRAVWSDSVALNGEYIDPIWFDIARHAIERESDYCVVDNEDWIREYVVMYFLIQQEIQSVVSNVDSSQTEGIVAGSLTDKQILELAKNPATLQMSGLVMRGKRKLYLRKITEDLKPVPAKVIRNFYRKLKSEEHPAIVDAVYVKRRQLIVPKGEISDAIERRIAKGDDFMDLYAEFDPVFNHAIEGKHWYLVKKHGSVLDPDMNPGNIQEYFSDWNRNVRNGEILGPIEYQDGSSIFYIQIVGKVHRDLVRLNSGLPGQPNHTKDWIRKHLEFKRLPQSKKVLRDNANVLVDGKLVYADETSFNCGRHYKSHYIH